MEILDKRYDFKKVEENKYDTWKSKGYFKCGDYTKPKFSLVLPPPNVTGKLHIGHAIDTTIMDITMRYKKAKGYDCLFLPGCDHAGIATQAKVDARLKAEGISRYDIGREAFLKKAFEWKEEYSEIIHSQWAKMGLMLDYTKERFTLDKGFNKAVYKVFKDLYDKGLIYRGERIVNYDTEMRTALSNIEVIYKEEEGEFFYFKYRFVENKEKYLVIATTRPETMFGDTCIVVNPNDKRYQDVIGKKVINPANNDELVIIADDYVDIKFGTGAMKCTPAHDPNDFIIGKKYGFDHPIIMNIDGTMKENCGIYSGLDRYECRKLLVENIKKDGNLIKIEKMIHNVGHSERTDTVVEPILSMQWFIKMKPLAEMVLNNQNSKEKVNFYPRRFEKVLTRWMENCEDWCISRQLWWGHRIPVYYSKTTNEILVSDHKPEGDDYYQDEDVLDTWFSSGLWPFATMGWPDETELYKHYFPTDLLVTGYDIIFFWVARMYFQSLNFTKQVPFKNVLIHGLVRDSKGRKMSKSAGNGVDPIDVINKYGTDSLRYFLATSSTPGQDMKYDEEKVNASSNYLNKIWNSARYILMNIDPNYIYDENIKTKELNLIDRYILAKLNKTIKEVTKYMDNYNYGIASNILFNFVYDDFCSLYLEYSKVDLKSDGNHNHTYFTLIYVLKAIIMMLYPFSPFICEEIYLHLPSIKESIMLENYPTVNRRFSFNKEVNQVLKLNYAIEFVRAYKVDNKLAPNASFELDILGDGLNKELIPYLLRFSFASDIKYIDKEMNTTFKVFDGFTLYINDNKNKDEIKNKLLKEIERLEGEIKRSEGLLHNQNFISKAPKAKIDLETEKYNKYLENLNEIKNKLNLL